MIGKNIIEFGYKDILEGLTSSPETDDGGFSPETNHVNITSSQTALGILYPAGFKTDKATADGRYIASCPDPDSGVNIYRYLLTSTGKFYSVDNTSATTLRATGTSIYVRDYTDMIVYRNNLYATSSTNVTKGPGVSLGYAVDEDWWTTVPPKSGGGFPSALTSGVPHPMIVFEDNLWIADGQKLHRWDEYNNIATEGFLTLNTGLVITALGIDPSSGKMIISATEGIDTTGQLPRQAKIYLYDGFSQKPLKAVIVDDVVTAIYPLGGVVYMCYGTNFGYWTGTGINFLRKFKSNTQGGTETLVYKQRITNVGKKLLFADGLDIVCFEETVPGKRRFYVAYKIPTSLINNIYDIIFSLGSNNIGMCFESTYTTYEYSVLSLSNVASGGFLSFYSKKYTFQRPVYIRDFRIEYNNAIATTVTPAAMTLIDQNKNSIALPALTNDSTSSTYYIYRKHNGNTKFTTMQFKYDNTDHTNIVQGIRRIVISYDVAE